MGFASRKLLKNCQIKKCQDKNTQSKQILATVSYKYDEIKENGKKN